MLINVDRNLCIGAAPCVAIAGNVFQLDEEGKAILVGPSTDDTNTHLAAEACPTRAIFLYADDKTQIYPPASESPRDYVVEPNSEPAPTAGAPANDNSAEQTPKAA